MFTGILWRDRPVRGLPGDALRLSAYMTRRYSCYFCKRNPKGLTPARWVCSLGSMSRHNPESQNRTIRSMESERKSLTIGVVVHGANAMLCKSPGQPFEMQRL